MAVFRRGKVWWYDFRFAGVRIRESTGARTRAQALQAEAIRKGELARGRGRLEKPEPSPRFVDFANREFANWCANEHRDRPSTFARYMRSVKALAEFFGGRVLEVIHAGAVERFKLHRSRQPRKNARDGRLVTPAAVNRDLAVLRILFNFAIRLGKARNNPVSGVRFLKESLNHMRALSAQEEERYLEAASPLLRDVAIVMLETGMRPGEVCSLRTADVDLIHASLHVREGKTIYATRHIPLTGRALNVLARRAADVKTEWLFPCPYDNNRPVAEVRKAHEAAVRRSGVTPYFRLYDLRHTALSRMAMSGIDLSTLRELAGHSQIQMTMRYVHPTSEHKRRAIERFEEASLEQRLF
ncbi:MAG: tyrosine-type recombinase/integrase [Terriglobales bacterium]